MRSFSLTALGLARRRSGHIMSRIAHALVEAETGGRVDLDPAAALRFLDSLPELLGLVPFAAARLAALLADHASPAVRRGAAGAARLLAPYDAVVAESMLVRLAGDPEAPVRSACARALGALVGGADDPLEVVQRWLAGSPEQRDAIERARRRLPAPVGTAPVKPGLRQRPDDDGPYPADLH
jgi:hypothetical protein